MDFCFDNIKVAQADIPESFETQANIVYRWQHDIVPFTNSVQAVDNSENIILYSSGREIYEDYLNEYERNIISSNPDTIKTGLRKYEEAQLYLTNYAVKLISVPVKPLSIGRLPGYYAAHLKECADYQYQYFMEHRININVQIEVSYCSTDVPVMKFEAVVGKQKVNILVGANLRRIDYYNAQPMFHPFSFFHAGKKAKKADVIQWGAERFFACIYYPDNENKAQEMFFHFVNSFRYNPELEKRASFMAEERYKASYMKAAQLAGNAQAFMQQSAAFRSQAAMNISRDLNSISDGIMDSWNMKNASEDRISRNFSEAIRGVNTYTDVNGKSFEFSNQADHVYTDQYGDHIGVSGNSLDENTKRRFNLKEVFKK